MILNCWKFGLVNSTIQKFWKNTNTISTNEQNGWMIKRVRKAERSDVYDVLIEWFKQHSSDKVPLSDPLYMIIFFLHKYQPYGNEFGIKVYGEL